MEKVYKTMGSAGVASLVTGIIILVTGIAVGIITIVQGARLLRGRSDVTF